MGNYITYLQDECPLSFLSSEDKQQIINQFIKGHSMKSEHQQQVEEFMVKAGQEVPDNPVVPNEETRYLRSVLIAEEAAETIEALGFKVKFKVGKPNKKGPNLVKIIDGCTDVAVVTTGTLSACGIEDIPVQTSVNNANLRKFAPGGYKREDGKWIKPPDFVGPEKDIEAYLESKK